jgi:hypothetical protein
MDIEKDEEAIRYRVEENVNHSWRALAICIYALCTYYAFSGKMDLHSATWEDNRILAVVLFGGPVWLIVRACYHLRQGKKSRFPLRKLSRSIYYGLISVSILFYVSLLFNFLIR